MAGVKAEANVAARQQLLDLPRRLDICAGVMVKGRLVATLPTQSHRRLQVAGQAIPTLGLQPKTPVGIGASWCCATSARARVGERGLGSRKAVGRLHGVEDVQHRPKFANGCVHAGRIRKWHSDVSAGQTEPACLESRLQGVLGPEGTDRSEVDPFVAVL